jgi:hypothetical protein
VPHTIQEPVVGSIAPVDAVAPSSRRTTAARLERRFELYAIDDLPNESVLPFLIKGVLPAGALAEVHGSPGAGKSFIGLAMALSVATGIPFFGHGVVRGRVLYVAAERFLGLRRRIEAWFRRHEAADRSLFQVMRDGVQLVDARDVQSFIRAVQRLPEPPSLIVLDTLSRCLVGADENGQRDMSKVVESLDAIRKATGATVLLVHHTRKAGDMERGSTVLRGAADLMMGVQAGKDVVSLRVEKVNDFSPFKELKLRLDAEGDSCVLVEVEGEADDAESGPAAELVRGDLRKLLEALREYQDGATVGTLAAKTDIPSSTVHRRCKEKLAPAGLVTKGERGGKYRLTEKGRQALG